MNISLYQFLLNNKTRIFLSIMSERQSEERAMVFVDSSKEFRRINIKKLQNNLKKIDLEIYIYIKYNTRIF